MENISDPQPGVQELGFTITTASRYSVQCWQRTPRSSVRGAETGERFSVCGIASIVHHEKNLSTFALVRLMRLTQKTE